MVAFGLEFDTIVPGSWTEMFDHSCFSCPILASSPENKQKASNKKYLLKRLETLGISHPNCYSPDEIDAIEYPVIVKPVFGTSGLFNRIARDKQELLSVLENLCSIYHHRLDMEFMAETVVIQDFLEGILSTKKEALSVAVNEQLIGIPGLISPSSTRTSKAC